MINRRSRSKQRVASKDNEKILYRINEQIRAERVRVIVDSGDGKDNKNVICSIEQALQMANDANLDLVEIVPEADPPVCKIVEYSKYKYQRSKHLSMMKAKSQKKIIKEISLGPNIGEHDYHVKLKKAIEFLEDGTYVKAYVFFKGRNRFTLFKQNGESLLKRFVKALEGYGVSGCEEPEICGNCMYMSVMPVKGGKGSSTSN